METSVLTKFNIPLLLRYKTPDVRAEAKNDPAMKAVAYFAEIEKKMQNDEKLREELSLMYSEKGWKQVPIQSEVFRSSDAESLTLAKLLSMLDREEKSRKLRVLAVDDVAVVLNAITAALGNHFEVFSLTKAEQVEKFLQHTVPELFLLDIEMPGMNGYDLIPIIRNSEEHKETPIMFLTGNATVKNFRASATLGVSEFIAKPVDPEVLLKKVKSKIIRKKTF